MNNKFSHLYLFIYRRNKLCIMKWITFLFSQILIKGNQTFLIRYSKNCQKKLKNIVIEWLSTSFLYTVILL